MCLASVCIDDAGRFVTSVIVRLTGASLQKSVPGQLVALNNADAMSTSWLDIERFRHLVGQAFYAAHIGEADAQLLAFDEDADYASPNFLWFRSRFASFVYVDRVIVAGGARGRGLARRLYEDLFLKVRERGHDRVVCEVNSQPPNIASDAFHAAMGFLELGTGAPYEDAKRVRYLVRYIG